MNWILWILIAFVEPQMSSKKASFDGKFCILEDNVVLDHPFGKLLTQKAILEKGDNDKLSFHKAWLEEQVEVFLSSGATLKGKNAEADLGPKTLIFTGDVVYQEPDGLQIFAQKADAKFVDKDSKFVVQAVSVKDQVRAQFPQGRTVICHQATYLPNIRFEIEGRDENPCHLKDLDLDLKAFKGEFNLIEESGFLSKVEANLLLPIAGVKSALNLKADEIQFSEKTQIIQSQKHTFVEAEAYSLKSELDEFKVKLDSNKQVEEAILNGHIHIVGPKGQKLDCPGILRLHEGRQQLVLKAHTGTAICCTTEDLMMKAARARLFYKQDGNRFIPVKLELEDTVELFDLRENRHIFGKAHQAHIFLQEDRVVLYGEGAKRVLYVDESLDMHLSAPEVLIHKNPQGKLSVQGVGAVRFSLNDEESAIIQKIKKLAHE